MDGKTKVLSFALWTIPVAIIVFVLKYLAYYLTGSVALYSDALESIVNVVASFAALWAIYISMKPADKDHPFGHNKAEYISAVIEGALIIVAAILIIVEAWTALKNPRIFSDPGIGLAINFISSVLNATWALILLRLAKKYRSPALEADGVHLMTDVFTSVGVLIGLLLVWLTGWVILDPLLAIIVAINILWQGWKVINSSVQGLMDAGVDPEENARIRKIVSFHAEGAIEAHDLRTRLAGRVTFIEFHLIVPSEMTVRISHDICNKIEDALKRDIPGAYVVIHVEPENEAKLPLGTTAVPFI